MGYLSKSDILKADDVQTEDVAVPEWGGKVALRGLSGAEGDFYTKSLVRGKGKKATTDLTNMTAKLCAKCIVDPESGERLFNDQEVAELGRKSASALKRVFKVAARLSGLDDEEQDEILKNSESQSSAIGDG